MSEPTTLLPCPFCGKKVAGIYHDNPYSPDRFGDMMVSICCFVFDGGCGASSGWYDTKADAIAAWNRRADE